MFIAITPVAKPRMTRSDKWNVRPAVGRYRAFCDELRLKYTQPLPPTVELIFHLPMPATMSKKQRDILALQPHQKRPDIDNLCKSIMDALCVNDSYVYELHARKIWSHTPGIIINTL